MLVTGILLPCSPGGVGAGLTVGELAHEVGVTGVAVGLGSDVDQQPVQGDSPALRPPARHLRRRIQREIGDRRVDAPTRM